MILPNNGKVCGYSLYNNGLNLFYNLLLKKDDIMPLKLNHSLIYNNCYCYKFKYIKFIY
jgi:hypothetical protein